MEDFLAGLVALEDGHGAAGEGEGFGEEFAEFVVGAALERAGVDFYLQRITEPADDRAARGVGDGFDGEAAGGGRCGGTGNFFHRSRGWIRINHCLRSDRIIHFAFIFRMK